MTVDFAPGDKNSLTDVDGISVGHATKDEPGWLTGCTVVLPPAGTVCGVDVRGGGPGTRETDLLDPRNTVDQVNAIVLGGGSALGLSAADGVARDLLTRGIGWPMDEDPTHVVPIVPAAILFDLGRAGTWGNAPGPAEGSAALAAASDGPVPMGNVGAGTGAKSGGFRGGIGSASVILPGGTTVAALVACNSVGSPVDPRTGQLYAVRADVGLDGEFDGIVVPSAQQVAAARDYAGTLPWQVGGQPELATTIGVIATDATLTKAQCQKTAGVGHDGMARALKPIHTLMDGDTLFTLATCARPAPDQIGMVRLMEAAADCVTRAIGHALLAASSVDRTADGGMAFRSWRDAFPASGASDPVTDRPVAGPGNRPGSGQ